MRPRFSAEVAGAEPRVIEPETPSPLAPWVDWLQEIAAGRKTSPPTALPLGKVTEHQRRALRLATNVALRIAAPPSATAAQTHQVWSGVYAILEPHTGRLCEDIDRGKSPRPGHAWVQEMVSADTRHALASETARLTLLNEALSRDAQSSMGRLAWRDALLWAPAMGYLTKADTGHWSLLLLEHWVSHALEAASFQAEADSATTTSTANVQQVEQMLKVFPSAVATIDALVSHTAPNATPLHWSSAVRHANAIVSVLLGQPSAQLSPMEVPPIYTSAGWRCSFRTPGVWKSTACAMMSTLASTEGLRAWDAATESSRQTMLDRIGQVIRATPSQEAALPIAAADRLAAHMEAYAGPAHAASVRRCLMEALTPPATVRTSPVSMRL